MERTPKEQRAWERWEKRQAVKQDEYRECEQNTTDAKTEGRKVRVGDKVRDQDYVVFIVQKADDARDHNADGYPNVARRMEEVGIVAHLVLRRPKGKKLYMATQNAHNHLWVYRPEGRGF